MIAELYKNIDLVQVDVEAGAEELQFPKNVDWASRKIDKLILAAPTASCLSPIDGQTDVYTRSDIADLFLDLYKADESELAHYVSFENFLHTNNHPVRIDSALSLNLSRMIFTTPAPKAGCLLFYVFYDTKEKIDYTPSQKNVTITLPMVANEKISFRDIVDTYVHIVGQKVRGLQIWDTDNNPVYLTLRDYQYTYVINSLYSGLARPQMAGATCEETQIAPLLLDSIDIDFDNSFVQNATAGAITLTMTIEY